MALRRGDTVPEGELPRYPKSVRWDRDPDFDDRVGRLKAVRDAAATRLDLDPGVLCSRDRMEAVARRQPESLEAFEEIPELRGWQVEVLGEGFLKALGRGVKSGAAGSVAGSRPAAQGARVAGAVGPRSARSKPTAATSHRTAARTEPPLGAVADTPHTPVCGVRASGCGAGASTGAHGAGVPFRRSFVFPNRENIRSFKAIAYENYGGVLIHWPSGTMSALQVCNTDADNSPGADLASWRTPE